MLRGGWCGGGEGGRSFDDLSRLLPRSLECDLSFFLSERSSLRFSYFEEDDVESFSLYGLLCLCLSFLDFSFGISDELVELDDLGSLVDDVDVGFG